MKKITYYYVIICLIKVCYYIFLGSKYPDASCVDPQYHGSSSQPAPRLYLLLFLFIVFRLICINASLTKFL